MRRIHVFERISADGAFALPDGDLDWPTQDPDLDRDATTGMEDADAILFGARTYAGFKSFWSKQLDDSPTSPSPHGPERRSTDLKKMATWINGVTKYVVSRSLRDASWQGTQLLGEFDPAAIAALKAGPGKAIMIFGSGTIVSLLTEHDLVDDYSLVISPIFLGQEGIPVIRAAKRTPLTLVDCTRFPTGNVRLRYTRV